MHSRDRVHRLHRKHQDEELDQDRPTQKGRRVRVRREESLMWLQHVEILKKAGLWED